MTVSHRPISANCLTQMSQLKNVLTWIFSLQQLLQSCKVWRFVMCCASSVPPLSVINPMSNTYRVMKYEIKCSYSHFESLLKVASSEMKSKDLSYSPINDITFPVGSWWTTSSQSVSGTWGSVPLQWESCKTHIADWIINLQMTHTKLRSFFLHFNLRHGVVNLPSPERKSQSRSALLKALW